MLICSLGRALKDERWGEGSRKLPEATGGWPPSPGSASGSGPGSVGPRCPSGSACDTVSHLCSPAHLPTQPGSPGHHASPSGYPPHGTQHLEHNRGLIIEGGWEVGARHTQAEPNCAPKKHLSGDSAPSPEPRNPQRHPAPLRGSCHRKATFQIFSPS